jgi:TrmH family RNA methyltransferase
VAERRFVVEGPQAVREALETLEVLFTTDLRHELAEAAAHSGIEVVQVDDKVLAALAETINPQGLVGVAPTLHGALPAAPRLVAVLHEVNDPGNAGTVIRTADAAGADAVVLTQGSVDPHNGKCVRATAGSLWHLPIVQDADPLAVLEALQGKGLRVLATTAAADVDLDEVDLTGPTAWVFGTEAHGLPEELLDAADQRVRIPVHGRAESLNLAAAAAVCLYASARAQRRGSTVTT